MDTDDYIEMNAEIVSLRQTIATLNEALATTSAGNFKLREQLAEYERERGQLKGAVNSYMKAYDDCREEHTITHAKLVALEEETAPKWRRYERVCEQLASVTEERDELATVLNKVVGVNDYDNMGAERLKFFSDLQEQLASVTKDAERYRVALEKANTWGRSGVEPFDLHVVIDEALAKIGAVGSVTR
jgi:chromosome segregation ATPase